MDFDEIIALMTCCDNHPPSQQNQHQQQNHHHHHHHLGDSPSRKKSRGKGQVSASYNESGAATAAAPSGIASAIPPSQQHQHQQQHHQGEKSSRLPKLSELFSDSISNGSCPCSSRSGFTWRSDSNLSRDSSNNSNVDESNDKIQRKIKGRKGGRTADELKADIYNRKHSVFMEMAELGCNSSCTCG